MNLHYLNRYNKFIDALKEQTIDGYYELHHIIPKSSGGSDETSNLIKLTARQHFIAHWILWKAYGGNLARAFFMMSNFGKYGKVNSRTYDKARKEYSEQVKLQMANKPNVPAFTEEHRQKLSLAKRGKKLSEETKEKLRLSRLGSKASEETKRKISESKKGIATRGSGWKHSEETKMKMKQTQAYLKWLDEGNTPLPADE